MASKKASHAPLAAVQKARGGPVLRVQLPADAQPDASQQALGGNAAPSPGKQGRAGRLLPGEGKENSPQRRARQAQALPPRREQGQLQGELAALGASLEQLTREWQQQQQQHGGGRQPGAAAPAPAAPAAAQAPEAAHPAAAAAAAAPAPAERLLHSADAARPLLTSGTPDLLRSLEAAELALGIAGPPAGSPAQQVAGDSTAPAGEQRDSERALHTSGSAGPAALLLPPSPAGSQAADAGAASCASELSIRCWAQPRPAAEQQQQQEQEALLDFSSGTPAAAEPASPASFFSAGSRSLTPVSALRPARAAQQPATEWHNPLFSFAGGACSPGSPSPQQQAPAPAMPLAGPVPQAESPRPAAAAAAQHDRGRLAALQSRPCIDTARSASLPLGASPKASWQLVSPARLSTPTRRSPLSRSEQAAPGPESEKAALESPPGARPLTWVVNAGVVTSAGVTNGIVTPSRGSKGGGGSGRTPLSRLWSKALGAGSWSAGEPATPLLRCRSEYMQAMRELSHAAARVQARWAELAGAQAGAGAEQAAELRRLYRTELAQLGACMAAEPASP